MAAREIKVKEVRKLTREYLKMDTDLPELIPQFRENYKKVFRTFYSAVWFSISLVTLVICAYQIIDRMIYYYKSPYKVQTSIDQAEVGDFVGIFIVPLQTDQSAKFDYETMVSNKFNEQDKCRLMPEFYMDNVTSMKHIWDLKNAESMIKSVTFTRGRKKTNVTLKREKYYMQSSLLTKITNEKPVPIDTMAKATIQFQVENMMAGSFNGCMIFAAEKNKIVRFADFANSILVDKAKHVEISYSIKKYEFLNRREEACVEERKKQDCHLDCFFDVISQNINVQCQLPFLPKTFLNDCNATNETCQSLERMAELRQKTNPRYKCNCARSCSETVVSPYYHTLIYNDKVLSVAPNSNSLVILTEYFSYDLISLFCDIGGYLGLYTGLACVDLCFAIGLGVQKEIGKKKLYKKPGVFRKKVLRRLEKLAPYKETFVSQQPSKPTACSYFLKTLKALLLIACFLLCFYQVVNRTIAFFEYPVYVTIEVREEKFVQLPNYVDCPVPDAVLNEKDRMIKLKNLTECVEDFPIENLLDPPSKYANDPELLWEEKADLNVKSAIYNLKYADMSSFKTILGGCTKFTQNVIEYNPGLALVFEIFASDRKSCLPSSKFFFMRSEDRIDLRSMIDHPHQTVFYMTLLQNTILRLNTPTNPCVSREKFFKCEDDCLDEKLNNLKFKCRLPFLKPSDLPLCRDSKSAKAVINGYTRVLANANATRDCNCVKMCEETYFVPNFALHTVFIEITERHKLVLKKFEFESNLREIFREEKALPFLKLVCDVGSAVGFFLGLSVFTLVKQLPIMWKLFNNWL